MIKLSYFMNKIKDVKIKDILSVFPMAAAICLTPVYKKKYTNAWLICEEPMEARDNGYHFFKYMCTKKPDQKCYYAIKKDSVDYKKVAKLGKTIEFGSIQHWLAYFSCRYNISSQKGGKPNAALCSFMELNNLFKPHNVFLQHGITINKVSWLFADCSRFDYFVTSTIPETKYIRENFGYPRKSIILTGMPRFDALHDLKVNKKRILIMPTWRYWFKLNSKKNENTDSDIRNSEYLHKWLEVLEHPQLKELVEKYDLEVIFYPHRNMQEFIDVFNNVKNPVTIASWKKYDIQELLKTSSMMITDYSSVFFDMAYMKKPIVYYQFDEQKFRSYQYDEGYFDYHNNPFGVWCNEADTVVEQIKKNVLSDFVMSDESQSEYKKIFPYFDRLNSERIYKILSSNEGK